MVEQHFSLLTSLPDPSSRELLEARIGFLHGGNEQESRGSAAEVAIKEGCATRSLESTARREPFSEPAMTMESLSSNEFPSYLVNDTITASPLHGEGGGHHHNHSPAEFFFESAGAYGARSLVCLGRSHRSSSTGMSGGIFTGQKGAEGRATGQGAGQAGKRKRRRRPRSCKNKEEAETQRMTHIAVERNRRRQMNEHLAVLRSLMPESYVQKGDQASIVGGAIDFVKELEQLAQSLEAQKRTLLLQRQQRRKGKVYADTEQPGSSGYSNSVSNSSSYNSEDVAIDGADSPPFAQFFAYPQYVWRQAPGRECCPSPAESQPAAPADIEVTLTETHANLRILSPKRPRQLLKMVAALQTLRLTILHLNVTTLDSMVLYSLNLK